MPSLIIFLDGQRRNVSPSAFHQLTPGVLKARGVFETLRVYQGKPFALKAHWKRLRCGLNILRMNDCVSFPKINQRIQSLVQDNYIHDGRLRMSIWKEKNKLRESIVLESVKNISNQQYKNGFKAVIVKDIFPIARDCRIKSLDYAIFRRAFLNAKRCGCEEAIFTNSQGMIVEGSRSNIFMIQKGCLFTPPTTTGCLQGITRQYVLDIAKKSRIPVRYKLFTPAELLDSDEAFLTNSIIEMMPLTRINGRVIAKGKQGAITRKIHETYRTSIPIPDRYGA
jgi:branched-subunit amino acid aminotransferase/4-amino-4-deoxychorismate lyase